MNIVFYLFPIVLPTAIYLTWFLCAFVNDCILYSTYHLFRLQIFDYLSDVVGYTWKRFPYIENPDVVLSYCLLSFIVASIITTIVHLIKKNKLS